MNSSQAVERLPIVVLTGTVLLLHAALAFYIGNRGWDDGAITLAFAKTLAKAGRFSLTPESAIVEGSSSALWTLIFSAIYGVFAPGFSAFIRASQLLAALCSAISAGILFRLIRPSFDEPWVPAMVSGGLFLTAPFLNETMNGMEMSMLTTLALALTASFQRPAIPSGFFIAGCAAAMAALRFESVIYLLAASVGMYFVNHNFKTVRPIVLGAVISATVMEVTRLLYFKDWLPNTFFAKQWAPYHETGQRIRDTVVIRVSQWFDGLSPYLVLSVLLMLLAAFPRRRGQIKLTKINGELFALQYALAVLVFNVAIGRNWGYIGRMQLSAAPLLAFVLISMAQRPMVITVRPALAGVGMFVSMCFSLYYLQWDNINEVRWSRIGGEMIYPMTPENYRSTGRAVDRLRVLLGMDRITWMVPDVGGSSLCCDRLEIIDSALLTDRYLAHQGYARFEDYLKLRRPDVIETHGLWAHYSNIYKSEFFRDQYRPVLILNNWLYVRNDLAEKLGWTSRVVKSGIHMAGVRYRGEPGDEAYVLSNGGKYLALDLLRGGGDDSPTPDSP